MGVEKVFTGSLSQNYEKSLSLKTFNCIVMLRFVTNNILFIYNKSQVQKIICISIEGGNFYLYWIVKFKNYLSIDSV